MTTDLRNAYETVERIRRSHLHARPNPAENPAWANCHMDCGILLVEIERMASDSRELIEERDALTQKVCELITQRQQAQHERDCAVEDVKRLSEALECLLPGLILDLRYATDEDDKDAMRSRVKTVQDALAGPADDVSPNPMEKS